MVTWSPLMITVIDYGMGNLRSVSKALESLGAKVRLTSDPQDVWAAEKLILPGVGAFPAAMQELTLRKLVDPIKSSLAKGTRYLGICLGLQLLFETSDEGHGAKGLGIIPGTVARFACDASSSLKIPHMGWNTIRSPYPPNTPIKCPLLKGIADDSAVYFVHSYCARPTEQVVVAMETDYGGKFPSMIWRGNIFATQFHPEKSQAIGLKLLENFINL